MAEVLGILGACAVLLGVIAIYYFYFDPVHIDEEARNELGEESPEERRRILSEHQKRIEEQRLEDATDQTGTQ